MQLDNGFTYDDLINTAKELFGDDHGEIASKASEALQQRRLRDKQMSDAIARTFSTDDGKKTLNWLADISVRYPALGIDDLIAIPASDREVMSGYRVGMNDFFYLIADAINQANANEEAQS